MMWIPVNEGLPKEVVGGIAYTDEHTSDFVLATITIKGKTGVRVRVARYSYTKKAWLIANSTSGKAKVLAWTPLPEPYDKKRKRKEESYNDVVKNEVAGHNVEKLEQITQLVEDYKDIEADYETIKYNLGHESFFQLASDMTDVLSTIKKIAEVLDEVH
jgi:hypothetical protein